MHSISALTSVSTVTFLLICISQVKLEQYLFPSCLIQMEEGFSQQKRNKINILFLSRILLKKQNCKSMEFLLILQCYISWNKLSLLVFCGLVMSYLVCKMISLSPPVLSPKISLDMTLRSLWVFSHQCKLLAVSGFHCWYHHVYSQESQTH